MIFVMFLKNLFGVGSTYSPRRLRTVTFISRRFFQDRRGNIAIISAVMMTAAVGMAGLVAEYGDGLFNRLQDQRDADVAAMAGATNYAVNNSVSAMSAAVSRAATLNGLASGAAAGSVVASPSGDGNQAVKVVVSTSVPLLLSRVLASNSTLPVSATAYAEIKQKSTGCILALDPTANNAITVSGSANVNAPNCDVVSDSSSSSSIDMSGGAQMTTPCAVSVGTDSLNSGLHLTSCSSASTHSASTPDPYASVPAQTVASGAACLTVPTLPATLPYGYYCHGLSISGTATFSAGPYYVLGNFAVSGSSHVTGTGVTFYVTGGTTAISGTATATLSAPTTGTYAGILFFGDRSGTKSTNNAISGGTTTTLTGVLYFPTEQITYSGGTAALSTCTQLVGDVITFSGTADVGNTCVGVGVANIDVAGQGYASLVQ